MKTILFIAPYSGRGGSEMYLYRFLKNYDSSLFQAVLITEKYSKLFAELAPKVKYEFMRKGSFSLISKKLLNRIGSLLFTSGKKKSFELFIEDIHKKYQPQQWVINTIIPSYALTLAKRHNIKTVAIIHEMPQAYSFVNYEAMKNLVEISDKIITNSAVCCDALKNMGRHDAVIQPCFIDIREISLKDDRSKLRDILGIKPDEFIWIGAGSQDYNKGIELFIKIASCCKDLKMKFIWLGAERNSGFSYYLEKLKEQRNGSNIIFTGEVTADYYDYLNMSDAFLMTSHQESFSLVCIEALYLQKPIIAYDCGGVSDFLNEQCGTILKTRDPEEWRSAMLKLMAEYNRYTPEILKSIAENYSTDIQIPSLTNKLLVP